MCLLYIRRRVTGGIAVVRYNCASIEEIVTITGRSIQGTSYKGTGSKNGRVLALERIRRIILYYNTKVDSSTFFFLPRHINPSIHKYICTYICTRAGVSNNLDSIHAVYNRNWNNWIRILTMNVHNVPFGSTHTRWLLRNWKFINYVSK